MKQRPIIAPLLSLGLFLACAQAQTKTSQPPPKQAGQKAGSTNFIDRVLKFLGISDSPSTLKGPGDEVRSGELWIADLKTGTTRVLASGAGYRSPIFLVGTNDVLVLHGNEVVRIQAGGGQATKLYSINGVSKLVGASADDRNSVLLLLTPERESDARVGLLNVRTGEVTAIPYDPSKSQNVQIVESLEGWSRTYGDRRIYVKRQSKSALSGTVEWSDVFLQVDGQAPMDVSQCDGDNCGQPSLAEDGNSLVFIRAKAD